MSREIIVDPTELHAPRHPGNGSHEGKGPTSTVKPEDNVGAHEIAHKISTKKRNTK